MPASEGPQKNKNRRTWSLGNLGDLLILAGVPPGQVNGQPGVWRFVVDNPSSTTTGTVIAFRETDT